MNWVKVRNGFRSFLLRALSHQENTSNCHSSTQRTQLKSREISTLTQKAEEQISWQLFKQLAGDDYKFTPLPGSKRNLLYLLLERDPYRRLFQSGHSLLQQHLSSEAQKYLCWDFAAMWTSPSSLRLPLILGIELFQEEINLIPSLLLHLLSSLTFLNISFTKDKTLSGTQTQKCDFQLLTARHDSKLVNFNFTDCKGAWTQHL